ncbi:hypothetical protein [Methylobacterium sp. J-070]|uniref:hypothetical protein n=1 Tax=Methylobacterium sp. J-070 TaxID=2836650 RepID=UPI001FBB6E5E|nr:hypothetical protein [Methylobacterium sp. J-070]MCJ2049468.1 hypothetical protein [Methylobacterium sp. J-070]
MTVSVDCALEPKGETAADPREAARVVRRRSSSSGALYRIGLPIALWIGFVNVAHHYYGKGLATDAVLHDVVEAELASRRCPGLRLDPAGFRELAQERGINHADLYQKRSVRLQKVANRLDRSLRANPEGGCQKMLDLYGETGSAPHLLTRT